LKGAGVQTWALAALIGLYVQCLAQIFGLFLCICAC